MMSYKTITRVAPAAEPFSVADLKAQTRVDSAAEDDLLAAFISAARDKVEKYCDRFFTTQTVTVLFNSDFPVGDLKLPYADLSSVSSVEYTDGDNVVQTVDGSNYTVDLDAQVLRLDGSWPAAKDVRVNCVTGAPVEFEAAKQAMMMVAADLYEHRTENILGVSVASNPAVKELLRPYRDKMGIK